MTPSSCALMAEYNPIEYDKILYLGIMIMITSEKTRSRARNENQAQTWRFKQLSQFSPVIIPLR